MIAHIAYHKSAVSFFRTLSAYADSAPHFIDQFFFSPFNVRLSCGFKLQYILTSYNLTPQLLSAVS